MQADTQFHASTRRVFRLTYSSRACNPVSRPAAVQLASDAASNNLGNQVSGVLFSENGVFLQWLEGPADRVCGLMQRIAADSRHTDVSILNAGWVADRRYSDWPMQLAELPISRLRQVSDAKLKSSSACDSLTAAGAFAGMTALYQQQRNRGDNWPVIGQLAERLIQCSPEALPALPDALLDMRARAQLVDDLAQEFMRGWETDQWNSFEIAVGLANFNRCWQRLGRAPEPANPRQRVAIILPPGNTEVIGAMAMADLLRASGISVRTFFESSARQTLQALSTDPFDAFIVSGSRLGWLDEGARERKLTHSLRDAYPATRTYLANRLTGPLVGWPDRLLLQRHDARALSADSAEWQTLCAMASRSTH
ncbi:MAG: BLUF domain-containing protein [Pseudomonadota bacterium]